jgi:Rieske Fe-S protein
MGRREFLCRALVIGAGLFAGYPLYRFITAERYRPPRKIRITDQPRDGQMMMEHDFAFYLTDGRPVAVSRRCTHLGCMLNYDERKGMFICPCHQSRFSREGRYISGPARKDLALYEVQTLPDNRGYIVLVT